MDLANFVLICIWPGLYSKIRITVSTPQITQKIASSNGKMKRLKGRRATKERPCCNRKKTASCSSPVWPSLLLNFEFCVMILKKWWEVTSGVMTSNAPWVALRSLRHIATDLCFSLSSCTFSLTWPQVSFLIMQFLPPTASFILS